VSERARAGAQVALGVAALGLAVTWLSGGCEERVAPGDVAEQAAPSGADGVAVEERVEPAIEWAAGQLASVRHTAVSSRVLARIEDVRVRAGSAVAEGDVVVVLDARDLAARAGEAEEHLRSAHARLELARTEPARAETLLRQGVGTRQRLDQAASELRSAEAAARGLEEALSEAKTALSFAALRAPVSGRVVDRLAEPGEMAVPGRPLLQIYDPSLLRAEAPVRESLAVGLRVGQPLRVEIAALGRAVEGAIDEIVPFAEPGARTLLVKVRLAAPSREAGVFAGMFARVAVPAGERRRLVVPRGAVVRIGQLEFVDVIGEDGRVARRLVTTGEASADSRVEVLSGLRAGERVVAPPEAVGAPLEAPRAPAPEAVSPEGRPAKAAEAVAALRSQLLAALTQALAQGPAAALDACRVEAPRIAERIRAGGVAVGRTSHRLRNPANAPEAWMAPLLEELRALPPQPDTFRTVDLGARGTGYVEPIYLSPLCVTCHGEAVEPALLERIRALYPDDAAVGFRVGELRGLFWAIAPRDTGS
jgi:RND family efflux transporter MFP subunit